MSLAQAIEHRAVPGPGLSYLARRRAVWSLDALYRPCLNRLWLLPLVIIACPAGNPEVWQIGIALVTSATMFVGLLLSPSPRPPAGKRLVRRPAPKLALHFEG